MRFLGRGGVGGRGVEMLSSLRSMSSSSCGDRFAQRKVFVGVVSTCRCGQRR